MATLTPQTPTASGLAPTYTAVGASDTLSGLQPGAKYILIVRNAGGSPDVVAVDDPNSVLPPGAPASTTWADLSVSVPATTGERIIAIDGSRFRDPVSSNGTVTHSFQTSVTAALIGPL